MSKRLRFITGIGLFLSVLLILGSIAACSATNIQPSIQSFSVDLLIKNGMVYDGSIASPGVMDIAIQGDTIVTVGHFTGSAKRTIDATGLIVIPGIIDGHNHTDMVFQIIQDQYPTIPEGVTGNYGAVYQGVSTIITGLCGCGIIDTKDWFAQLTEVKFASNVYHLIPHGDLRRSLFGENQPKKLSPAQLEQMKNALEKEMEQGALGLSTGLEYVPGSMSDTDELIELCKVVKKYQGFYVTHVRDESGLAPENIGVMKAYQEAINIGKASGVAVHFSHMKITAPYHGATAVKLLEMVDKAREEGVDITGDQYPYDFFSTNLEIFLPQNYLTSIGVKPEYRTGEGKTEIIEVIKQYFAQISQGQVSSIVVFSSRPSYNRKSLGEIARTLGKSLAEAYIEVITETDDTPFGIFFFMREDDMKEFMKKEYVFTVSDGFAMSTDVAALFPNLPGHPRSFGAFPRKIRKYALDEQVIPLQQAIRSMTSLPAERFHMKKRGRIAQGYYADITILDLKKLKDTATYQNYAQYAEGIEYLLVNGQLEIDQETITGIRSGRFLKMGD